MASMVLNSMVKTLAIAVVTSVGLAGDINGDGVPDLLIGAKNYPGGASKGRTYVVFGDIPPVLVNNQMIINQGQTILVNGNSLISH